MVKAFFKTYRGFPKLLYFDLNIKNDCTILSFEEKIQKEKSISLLSFT
jgi:hypothetical protein